MIGSRDELVNLSQLSPAERFVLAQRLLDSVAAEATPLTSDQLQDMLARAEAIDGGEPCEDADALLARLKRSR